MFGHSWLVHSYSNQVDYSIVLQELIWQGKNQTKTLAISWLTIHLFLSFLFTIVEAGFDPEALWLAYQKANHKGSTCGTLVKRSLPSPEICSQFLKQFTIVNNDTRAIVSRKLPVILWLDSNCGPLVLKPTALPTGPTFWQTNTS